MSSRRARLRLFGERAERPESTRSPHEKSEDFTYRPQQRSRLRRFGHELAKCATTLQAFILGGIGFVISALAAIACWDKGPEFGPHWYARV